MVLNSVGIRGQLSWRCGSQLCRKQGSAQLEVGFTAVGTWKLGFNYVESWAQLRGRDGDQLVRSRAYLCSIDLDKSGL